MRPPCRLSDPKVKAPAARNASIRTVIDATPQSAPTQKLRPNAPRAGSPKSPNGRSSMRAMTKPGRIAASSMTVCATMLHHTGPPASGWTKCMSAPSMNSTMPPMTRYISQRVPAYMPSGPAKTSRNGDSRRTSASIEGAGEASGVASGMGCNVDGSPEGGSGLVSIGVWNMVKHSVSPVTRMLRRFLQSDAFRAPQFAAAALLLVYLLQCVWLVRVQTLHGPIPDSDQALRIYQGLAQWQS